MAELSITAASVLAASGSETTNGTSGATLTAGMAVYRDANNRYQKSLANAVGAAADVDGIVLNGASNGQPVQIVRTGANLNLGATLTVGQTYVVSNNTAGAIMPVSDLASTHVPIILGIANAANNIKLSFVIGTVAKA